ncbi:MAG: hypothetical protein H6767_06615 [Candidatus Peribacteria bacterium]|nr:MAG: hypothetical protein H6767_06615 [Candidatus Peribacteria bacterium]
MKKRNGVYVETTVEVLPKDRLFLIVNAMTRNAIDIDVNDPNASVELHDQLMPVTPS